MLFIVVVFSHLRTSHDFYVVVVVVVVVVCRGVLPGRELHTIWLLREAIRPPH